MINVSNEFRKLMNVRSDFKENAQITFSDGSVKELSEKDFTIVNNGLVDASESNGIPLGVALCRNIQIELMNDDDRFSEYDFFGAVIRFYLTFQLSETVERIEYGTFTVNAPETYGETVIITALDDMYKADADYTTNLVFPATVKSILVDACDTLDIPLGTTSFLNDDFAVSDKPEGITFRQLFGYIAMIAGGNARIDSTGRLQIISYDFDNMDSIRESVLNGGDFIHWDNPQNLDGGSFSPWNEGDSVDGGSFGDRKNIHILGNWNSLKVDTDDVVVTGVKCIYSDNDNNELEAIYGQEGYVLSIENPLIAGKEQFAVDLIGTVMVGARFRQFSGDLVADPTCEFMDTAVIVDRKGNTYISFITDVNFNFFGFTNLKNSAETAMRNSSITYSEATKALISARKLIKKERTARELAVDQLAKDLSNSSGMFMTQEQQPDGSIIYYMHDKKTLAESMIVWKLTALAFGISTDGGKTYPYGFTVDGTTITRLLYAEGINADFITSGTIDADKVNVINVVAKNIEGDSYSGKKYVSNYSGDSSTLGYCTKIDASEIITTAASGKGTLNGALLKLEKSTSYSKIEGPVIESNKGVLDYTKIDGKSITSYGGTSDNCVISGAKMTFTGSGKLENTSSLIGMEKTSISINSSYLYIGTNTSTKLGFFGTSTSSAKKSVSAISSTSSATASSNATKINELINALKAYNLI